MLILIRYTGEKSLCVTTYTLLKKRAYMYIDFHENIGIPYFANTSHSL